MSYGVKLLCLADERRLTTTPDAGRTTPGGYYLHHSARLHDPFKFQTLVHVITTK